jgi:hypothetical protein
VVPWLAWNPDCENLPDPPPDPELIEAIRSRLEREIRSGGRPVCGQERTAAFRRAVRRLELIGSTRPATISRSA